MKLVNCVTVTIIIMTLVLKPAISVNHFFCCGSTPEVDSDENNELLKDESMERTRVIVTRQGNEKGKEQIIESGQGMNIQLPIVWVIGGPGSGKSILCGNIVAANGFTHISLSDLLAAEIRVGSTVGRQLSSIIESNGVVPKEIIMKLLKKAINHVEESNGLLFEGFVQNKKDGQEFEEAVKPVDMVLYLKCTRGEMIERSQNRGGTSSQPEDTLSVINDKVDMFKKNIDSILKANWHKVKFVIASDKTAEEVFAQAEKHLLDMIASIN